MNECIEAIKMKLFLLSREPKVTWDHFYMRELIHCDINHAGAEAHWLSIERIIESKI